MLTDLVLLGASGFVGAATLEAALAAGLTVAAWARTEPQAAALRARGVVPLDPPHIPPTAVVVDLVQPALPARLTEAALGRAAEARVAVTRTFVPRLPPGATLLSVSGTDDFGPGVVSHRSAYTATPAGFARIGAAMRADLAAAGVPVANVHLGTVYGPGKAFAARLFPLLAKGRLPVIGAGDNRLPLVHVDDAGRALVHLAGLDTARLRAHPWIVTDGTATTQRALLEAAARLLHAPPPRTVPRWLAALAAGSVGAHSLARDVPTDPSALRESGFTLRYPSIETGLPATLARLGLA